MDCDHEVIVRLQGRLRDWSEWYRSTTARIRKRKILQAVDAEGRVFSAVKHISVVYLDIDMFQAFHEMS